jgi:hypothetical protein
VLIDPHSHNESMIAVIVLTIALGILFGSLRFGVDSRQLDVRGRHRPGV